MLCKQRHMSDPGHMLVWGLYFEFYQVKAHRIRHVYLIHAFDYGHFFEHQWSLKFPTKTVHLRDVQ